MKKKTKIKLTILALIVLCVGGVATYYCINYFFYNKYKQYIKTYDYEEGKEYKAIADSSKNVEGMELVSENDYLKLYTNPTTTEIAIYDKRTKKITYSNPIDRANDSIAIAVNKTDLDSQMVITYLTKNMVETTMYNSINSVSSGNYKTESIENGVRYIYTFGAADAAPGFVPELISAEQMERDVYSKLEAADASEIKKRYLKSKKYEGYLELIRNVKDNKLRYNTLKAIFNKTGLEPEMLEGEAAIDDSTDDSTDALSFTIPIEYRLKGDKLEVNVPTDQIVETGGGKLYKLQFLKYFGAANSTEEGYILVPNGSGSIINFNNGKVDKERNSTYLQYFYGMDPLSMAFITTEYTSTARLPIFGFKYKDSAIFAEVTKGDALAYLTADVNGNVNSYNYAYPTFTLRGTEEAYLFGKEGAGADVPIAEKALYETHVAIEYAFLEEKDASYSGMANYYRNELIKEGVLAIDEKKENIPFYLDILGGVMMEQSLSGIQYNSVYPMTTFKDAGKIYDKLYEANVKNINMNYLGWFNDGYYHDVADKIKVQGALGGNSDLKELVEKVKANGGKVFGDVAFQGVSFESDRFNYDQEAAHYLAGYVCYLGQVNPATLRNYSSLSYDETCYNLISPKFLPKYVGKFADKITDYDLTGVALRDLGDILTSDRKLSEPINRQEALDVVKAQFDILAETGKDMMVSGGNAYSLKYASDIYNIPASASTFALIDAEVPFYQMVVHGSIDYTGGAINLSDTFDKNDVLLSMVEYAINPRFTFSMEDSSEIKYSGMNTYYSTQYEIWFDQAVSLYQEANAVLKQVTGSVMVNHEILQTNVAKVTYDNGVVIYVNKTDEAVTVDGVTINAKSYVTKEAK